MSVIFDTRVAINGKQIGVATLSNESALNALTLVMAEQLYEQLLEWEEDPAIACVVLQGAGDKAFCAGGDIVSLHKSLCEHGEDLTQRYAEQFFELEYQLDYLIHSYTKPVLCWGHGIIMGGGLSMVGNSPLILLNDLIESTNRNLPSGVATLFASLVCMACSRRTNSSIERPLLIG